MPFFTGLCFLDGVHVPWYSWTHERLEDSGISAVAMDLGLAPDPGGPCRSFEIPSLPPQAGGRRRGHPPRRKLGRRVVGHVHLRAPGAPVGAGGGAPRPRVRPHLPVRPAGAVVSAGRGHPLLPLGQPAPERAQAVGAAHPLRIPLPGELGGSSGAKALPEAGGTDMRLMVFDVGGTNPKQVLHGLHP